MSQFEWILFLGSVQNIHKQLFYCGRFEDELAPVGFGGNMVNSACLQFPWLSHIYNYQIQVYLLQSTAEKIPCVIKKPPAKAGGQSSVPLRTASAYSKEASLSGVNPKCSLTSLAGPDSPKEFMHRT